MNLPVIDLHCDLLSYLQEAPKPDPAKNEGIGSNFPALEAGNVKLQIMAIYASTQKGSTDLAHEQSLIFKNLVKEYNSRLFLCNDLKAIKLVTSSPKFGILAAIENASCFCEEDESLESGFKKFETILTNTGRIAYIGLTHHGENRFGGGNSTKIGLKKDGMALLHYMNGKEIALDFSHASDALAFDMLNYIAKHNLSIPVMASHSNFRTIFNHVRNLPDELAKEIIKRKGIIGINFLRAFLNDKDSNAIYDHIYYGIKIGAAHSLCFGADYFYTAIHPDQSRKPFFYPEQDNAACYPSILNKLSEQLSPEILRGISNKNCIDFFTTSWA